jgi:hypothetical protein
MASRQNRKKKGRANQQNRERTVTTLTEDPNTQFLVPTPSEEPAGANMSSPFSVSSSSGGGPNSNIPTNGNYQVSGNFGYSGPPYSSNFVGSVQHSSNANQQQPLYQPQLALPSGRDDLEILENLKAQIKAGQHDRFQPNPQPLALLNVYQEGLQSEAQYLQQDVTDYQGAGFNQMDYDVGSATSNTGTGAAPSTDASRRLPHIQTKDAGDQSSARISVQSSPVSGPQPQSLCHLFSIAQTTDYISIRRVIQRHKQEIGMVPTMQIILHLHQRLEMIRAMFRIPRLLLLAPPVPILPSLLIAGSGAAT